MVRMFLGVSGSRQMRLTVVQVKVKVKVKVIIWSSRLGLVGSNPSY
jgi:hypothetical protein